MVKHVPIVAMVLGAYSAFQVFVAVSIGLLFMLLGGGMGAAGAAGGEEELLIIGVTYGFAGGVVAVFAAVMAIPGFAAAFGIYQQKSWGRILGFIVAALACTSFPIGTLIGVYCIFVLLDRDVAATFS